MILDQRKQGKRQWL